jgi:hypothetical protein
MLGKKPPAPKPVDPDKWYPGKLLGKPNPAADDRSNSSASTQSVKTAAASLKEEYEYRESEHLMSVRRGKM